jgi:hypothetical protein
MPTRAHMHQVARRALVQAGMAGPDAATAATVAVDALVDAGLTYQPDPEHDRRLTSSPMPPATC